MSAEIVNLRLARKRAKRKADGVAAEQNRSAHGRSAGERAATRYEADARERTLDNSRRQPTRERDDVS